MRESYYRARTRHAGINLSRSVGQLNLRLSISMTLLSKDDKPWYDWDLMLWCAAWLTVHRLPGVCWILISDLKVLISTLPVKGEESLDLQPSDTAGDPSGCPVFSEP